MGPFKEFERKFPNHGIQGRVMVKIFYEGFTPSSRTLVNTVPGGSFIQKTKNEAHAILKELTSTKINAHPRMIMKIDLVTSNM